MTQLKYNLISFLFLIISSLNYGQNSKMVPYIPYNGSSILNYPELTIKIKLHLVYRYKDDAQNYNLDSVDLIREQFGWINGYYKDLSNSTLIAQDGNFHFIPDSRIRFRIDNIDTIIDSLAWNRMFIGVHKTPVIIDSINKKDKKIYFNNKFYNRIRKQDSILVEGKVYKIKSKKKLPTYSQIEVKTPLSNKEKLDEFFYYLKKDLNCDRYLWEKFTNSDKNYLHIFYTGSTLSNVAFGCGPSPYYLNVSNFIKGGGWANAQLLAHEIGHTLGLYHTDRPQFNDLPKKDKFGFIPCDSTYTSNNIMGYNQCRNYLSPKQIGHIHYLYTTDKNRIRQTTANEFRTENTIVIYNDTTWSKSMLITGDIVVKKGKILNINSNIHLSKGSTIYLEKKSKLIIDKSNLYNCFNTKWLGIIKCKAIRKPYKQVRNPSKKADITLKNEAQILDAISIPN